MKGKGLVVFQICLVLVLGIVFFTKQKTNPVQERTSFSKNEEEIRAIYISYIELSKYLDTDVQGQKDAIHIMVENIEKDGFTWILLHTRSFSDSIYPSEIFPTNYSITRDESRKLELDILQQFIEEAHAKNIEVHAWINPYRIRNDEKTETIAEENPAFALFQTNSVKVIENKGIFYNPASEEVQNLIVAGIEEIVLNYDVDGIHLDDYFYPDKMIDLDNYQEYLNQGGTLDIEKYRLEQVNRLIRKIYDVVHKKNKNILFGIAPDGNVTNDYQVNYADILTWLKEDFYVDYIMPQLYYGFQNETKPFIQTLNDWNNYIKNTEISFIPALALYKAGNIDTYAKAGKAEWMNHSNIISRQIQVARNMKQYQGFSIFRYDSFYAGQNDFMKLETEEIRKLFRLKK